eukprot:3959037-Lingulodinium_polyedra.AAC.1
MAPKEMRNVMSEDVAEQYRKACKGNPDWHEVDEVLPDCEELMKYRVATTHTETSTKHLQDTQTRSLTAKINDATPK